MRALIDFVQDSHKYKDQRDLAPHIGRGIGLAFGIFLVQAFVVFCNVHAFARGFGSGILLRGAVIQAVFQRGMKLSSRARIGQGFNTGKLVTFISADASRIDFSGQFFHMTWTSLVQVLICIALLCWQLEYSALPGIAFLFLMSPVQTLITKQLFKLRKNSMIWTERRNKAINELVGGIRVVKQFAWEKPYAKRIHDLRKEEMKFQRRRMFLRSVNLALAFATPTLAAVLSFVTYALVGNGLQAGIIFSSLVYFQLLRTPLQFLPVAWNAVVDAKNASDRIDKLFEAELFENKIKRDPDSPHGVFIVNASFTWESAATPKTKMEEEKEQREKAEKQAASGKVDDAQVAKLEDINLVIPRGSLCAIIGGVGSGKSSLLSALTGEMRQTSGNVTLATDLAVCNQVAWIQSASIKDNIIFGSPYDPSRYREVLRACALLPDLAMLESGDQTVVGEKGVSLSGGQKQRINIARALYNGADTVLLDDCLSALDARVGSEIFTNVLAGPAMAGKTRILVTHALYVLQSCDWIVLMDEGRIAEQGTFAQLRQSSGRIADLLRLFTKEKTQPTDEDGQQATGASTGHETEHSAVHTAVLAEAAKEEVAEDVAGRPAGLTGVDKVEDEEDLAEAEKEQDGTQSEKDSQEKPKALMQAEERYSGSVGQAIYLQYLRSAPLWLLLPPFAVAIIIFQGSTIVSPLWLMWWQDDSLKNIPSGVYMGLYAVFGATQSLGLLGMGVLFACISISSATTLHNKMLDRILHAPFSFFDTTPQGRVTHRFSKDVDTLDNLIGDMSRMLLGTIVQVVGSIVLIAVLTPFFLIAVAVVVSIYLVLALYYRSTAREVRRVDAVLRSNMHEHFSESLNGVSTIRAYGQVDDFIAENCKRIDRENRAYWLSQVCQRWLSIRLDFLGSLLVFAVALLATGTRFSLGPGQTGVALSYIMTAQSLFGWVIRHSAELENNMSAVERVVHYATQVEQERPYYVPDVDQTIPPSWPSTGAIEFDHVDAQYKTGTRKVLNDLTLHIRPGEKIGFVGRTGAGKSTLVTLLLRTLELAGGKISIDGVDISTMGLQRLRSSLTLIPQDAVIYSGTLRYNLDPLGEYDDTRLADALQRTSLSDLSLDMDITEEGSNLSAGQRSLVSIARAMIRRTRICILDEATASIDQQTDQKIQHLIETGFEGITTLTVAHRIQTIVHYDRVCVLDQGRIAEVAPPAELYNNTNSIFHALCTAADIHFEKGVWT